MLRITTRIMAILSVAAVLLLQAGMVFARPPIWESRLGATVPGQALDNRNDGTVSLTFETMSFPFDGIVYTGNDILNISSNGFISLGGDNGDGCCDGDPANLTGDPFPRIAPYWIDLDPGSQGGDIYYKTFNDDNDPETDRIVITFSTGFSECSDIGSVCYVHAQVQLLEDGTIIFGYNGIGINNSITNDLLVGISPGGGTADPGSIDLITASQVPFDSGMEPTIYELLAPAFPDTEDLIDLNFIFTPNGIGGFVLSDTMADPPPSNDPPEWESDIGTPTNALGPFFLIPGLDNTNDATMGLTFGAFDFSFPFNGVTYSGNDLIFISSNGFISLGGDNGTGCLLGDCSGDPQQLLTGVFPTIAPFWTDLDPGGAGGEVYVAGYNDDPDPENDRIVITFVTGLRDCVDEECSALTQVQLEEDGTITFGYNDIVQTNSQASDILVGVSEGAGAVDPGNTDFSRSAAIDTGTNPTVYELFVASSPPPIDLEGGNVVFEPNGQGGFIVTTPGIGGAGVGAGGGGGGGSGCTMQGSRSADPLFPVLLAGLSLLFFYRRRLHKR